MVVVFNKFISIYHSAQKSISLDISFHFNTDALFNCVHVILYSGHVPLNKQDCERLIFGLTFYDKGDTPEYMLPGD